MLWIENLEFTSIVNVLCTRFFRYSTSQADYATNLIDFKLKLYSELYSKHVLKFPWNFLFSVAS